MCDHMDLDLVLTRLRN